MKNYIELKELEKQSNIMIKTNKQHWINGRRDYANGLYKTFALSCFNYGAILSYASNGNFTKTGLSIKFYQLIKE